MDYCGKHTTGVDAEAIVKDKLELDPSVGENKVPAFVTAFITTGCNVVVIGLVSPSEAGRIPRTHNLKTSTPNGILLFVNVMSTVWFRIVGGLEGMCALKSNFVFETGRGTFWLVGGPSRTEYIPVGAPPVVL